MSRVTSSRHPTRPGKSHIPLNTRCALRAERIEALRAHTHRERRRTRCACIPSPVPSYSREFPTRNGDPHRAHSSPCIHGVDRRSANRPDTREESPSPFVARTPLINTRRPPRAPTSNILLPILSLDRDFRRTKLRLNETACMRIIGTVDAARKTMHVCEM